jgi:hypothetical protein
MKIHSSVGLGHFIFGMDAWIVCIVCDGMCSIKGKVRDERMVILPSSFACVREAMRRLELLYSF